MCCANLFLGHNEPRLFLQSLDVSVDLGDLPCQILKLFNTQREARPLFVSGFRAFFYLHCFVVGFGLLVPLSDDPAMFRFVLAYVH